MIDIETCGTLPDSIILTIGAVFFQRKGHIPQLEDLDTFYRRIDIQSCIDAGLTSSQETMDWWAHQSEEAQYEALHHPDRIPLRQALQELSLFVGQKKKIWANSPSFDIVILENAMRATSVSIPWNFWNTRDVRTIMDLGGLHSADLGEVPHHALQDCYRQIRGVKMALQILGHN